VDVVLVLAVSLCVGMVLVFPRVVVVSVLVGRGVGFERAGDELAEPVGGDEGCGTTVVVATAAPGAALPVEVSRVLVAGPGCVDDTDDGGFVGMVVFAAVAVVPLVSVDIAPPAGTTGRAVPVVCALLVVTDELVVSVVWLDADSVLLHANISIATAMGIRIFRMNYLPDLCAAQGLPVTLRVCAESLLLSSSRARALRLRRRASYRLRNARSRPAER
jgi:hypothetical protein